MSRIQGVHPMLQYNQLVSEANRRAVPEWLANRLQNDAAVRHIWMLCSHQDRTVGEFLEAVAQFVLQQRDSVTDAYLVLKLQEPVNTTLCHTLISTSEQPMGVVRQIDYESFPEQTDWVGKRTRVCFKYDTSHTIGGTVVRDDKGEPGVMIIRLDDGRHVLATECMHDVPVDAAGDCTEDAHALRAEVTARCHQISELQQQLHNCGEMKAAIEEVANEEIADLKGQIVTLTTELDKAMKMLQVYRDAERESDPVA